MDHIFVARHLTLIKKLQNHSASFRFQNRPPSVNLKTLLQLVPVLPPRRAPWAIASKNVQIWLVTVAEELFYSITGLCYLYDNNKNFKEKQKQTTLFMRQHYFLRHHLPYGFIMAYRGKNGRECDDTDEYKPVAGARSKSFRPFFHQRKIPLWSIFFFLRILCWWFQTPQVEFKRQRQE